MEIVLTARKERKVILRPTEKLVVTNNSAPAYRKIIPGKSVDEPPLLTKNITQFNPIDSLIVQTSCVRNKLVLERINHKKQDLIMHNTT